MQGFKLPNQISMMKSLQINDTAPHDFLVVLFTK